LTTYGDPTHGPRLERNFRKADFAKLTVNDCSWQDTVETQLIPGFKAAASNGPVRSFKRSFDGTIGPFVFATESVSVGIWWSNAGTGSAYPQIRPAGAAWGPDCTFSSLVMAGGTDQGGWCGVYRDGSSVAEPGANFYSAPFVGGLVGAKKWFYMRYWAYQDGSSSTAHGGPM
jgi:hypothetical protein